MYPQRIITQLCSSSHFSEVFSHLSALHFSFPAHNFTALIHCHGFPEAHFQPEKEAVLSKKLPKHTVHYLPSFRPVVINKLVNKVEH